MISWQLISFFSFLIFIWLLMRLGIGLVYWLYLWQRKEYRFDRFWAHLKLPEGRRQVMIAFNPFIFIARKPKFTLRVILFFGLILLVDYQLYFSTLRLLSIWVRQWPILLFPIFSVSLLLIFWITPFAAILVNISIDFLLKPVYGLFVALAKLKLKSYHPLVIGITGSFGKTAMKQILREVLATQFKVLATDASVNTLLGIAKTILFKLKSNQKIFIVEMGAYKSGEIKQLTDFVKPKIGIITGINPQHNELFGNQEKIVQGKYELIQALPRDGLAVFNGENSLTAHLAKQTKNVKVKVYSYPSKPYKTGLLGHFQQLNIQGALIVADYLGVSRLKALQVVEQLAPKEMLLKVEKGWQGCLVIDDSHNANPDGFWEALQVLKQMPAKRKIVITGGIVELGLVAAKVHQRLGKCIAEVADRLILTSQNFEADFRAGAGEKFDQKIEIINSNSALKSRLRKLVNEEAIVLLEGWNWSARKILLKSNF
ncbi:hypothetical protein A2160_02195 [Candidatus Beckwithbacteria bacterium RBG_13_42_9]|uniref:Mur ligase central domain-containing protein n=1 Tax=Candidatus Beckwithbacteria bacterium RBG_13_42_9 TaxID=1797457 RepID=A0A1F5E7D2_9BACT|nr:MAG: hypothetical protein A2160_02195 [Candidatus Beckwithbacteria bacterium RBG_13_42_9]